MIRPRIGANLGIIALSVAAALLLTACGGGDDETSSVTGGADGAGVDVASITSPASATDAVGDPLAPDPTASPAPSSTQHLVEDSLPISVSVAAPAAPVVGPIELRVTILIGLTGWDAAALSYDVDGPLDVEGPTVLEGIMPNEPYDATVVLSADPGSFETPTESRVLIVAETSTGGAAGDRSGTAVSVVADDQRVWVGTAGIGALLRERLVDLLSEGSITQAEFDERYDGTTQSDEPIGTVARVDDAESGIAITFAAETGKGFYDQVEDAIDAGDEAPFFDFAKMPTDWSVPEPRPRAGFRA